jgi:hypothetical protein
LPAFGSAHVVSLERTGITSLAGLETLQIIEEELVLLDNPALASLRALTGLAFAHHVGIGNNPVLPTCDADWLLGRVTVDISEIYGNDDGAVCPP